MAKVSFEFTCSDWQGQLKRWYIRKQIGVSTKGKKQFRKVRMKLDGVAITQKDEGTPRFQQAYDQTLAEFDTLKPRSSKTTQSGSLAELIVKYETDPASPFQALKDRTQYVRSGILGHIRKEHGHRSAAGMTEQAIIAGRNARRDTPAQANNILKALRALYDYGMEAGLVPRNPAANVKPLPMKSDGFHTWTMEEIEQYEATHPVGTMARLAFDLLIWTGQRLGDVIVMGPQHIKDGTMSIRQQKTGELVEIPVMPELRASIEATKTGDMAFIISQYGTPFKSTSFGNRFRKWCNEAGLNGCSAHGLRKACASLLAEAGCTPNEIASITGHTTLKEVGRYTRRADRKRMAVTAMNKLNGGAVVVPINRDTDNKVSR